jgi:hemerythrin
MTPKSLQKIALQLHAVDEQHDAIREMSQKLLECTDHDPFTALVQELSQMLKEHFSDEEKLMKAAKYPCTKEHAQLHKQLLAQLEALMHDRRLKAGELFQPAFLTQNWLLEHIRTHDGSFLEFVQTHVRI